jgi:hypothetical protein
MQQRATGGAIRRMTLVLLLLVIGYCSVQVHRAETQRRRLKEDLKEISHITYGLFNVNAWRDVLAHIITVKVEALEITPENREELKKHIEKLMNELLTELEDVMEKRNKKSGLSGVVRQIAMDVFVDIKSIRAGIPRYADLIVDYLNDPKNRKEITGLILTEFDKLANKTVGEVDFIHFERILERYGCTDKETCAALLQERIVQLHDRARMLIIILFSAFAPLLWLLFRPAPALSIFEPLVMVGAALCLLVTGITLPMIDIEATIKDFSFQLMGEPVTFTDQVLFYQSKSIVDVVRVLILDGDPGLVLVGVLVLLFSVIMPVSKLTASLIAIGQRRLPKRKFSRFLVLRSAKWSMADVMVVAIFMAFIGFSGIVSNQMEELENYSTNVRILTTNDSGLQFGFHLFLAYCIMGLLLGLRLERLRARVDKG